MNKLPIDIFLMPNVYNVKAFNRAKTAHHNARKIIENVAYNEVDSVVYIKNKKNIDEQFVAGQKYSYAIECVDGSVTIEYGQVDKLNICKAYNDLTDKKFFTGNGIKQTINKGEILILELDEAFKYTEINGNFIEYKIAKDGGIK